MRFEIGGVAGEMSSGETRRYFWRALCVKSSISHLLARRRRISREVFSGIPSLGDYAYGGSAGGCHREMTR